MHYKVAIVHYNFYAYIKNFNLFSDLFLAVLDLRCGAWVFSSCGEPGLLSSCAAGLIAMASHVGEQFLG